MTREKIIRMLLVDDVEAVRQRCGRSSRLIHVSPLRAKPATEEMLSHGSNDAVLGGGDEHSDAAPQRHRDDAAHCTVCSCVGEVGLSVQATEDV